MEDKIVKVRGELDSLLKTREQVKVSLARLNEEIIFKQGYLKCLEDLNGKSEESK